MIAVRQTNENNPLACTVVVDSTQFHVTLDQSDLDILGDGRPVQEVVAAAFHFLLDREPKEAILRRFDLKTISRYFPEFEQVLPDYFDRIDRSGGST